MNVGFIGYGKHAKRIQSLFDHALIKSTVYYHPTKKISNVTNDLNDLYKCDAVFITSPNSTHFDYLHKLIKNSSCYVFCEKPPVINTNELMKLKEYTFNQINRIYFNFNFRMSEFSNYIKNINNEAFGKLINLNLKVSHGLAHKKEYATSWRGAYKNNKSSVFDTVLVHFIDLINYSLPDSKDLNILSVRCSSFVHGNDTCSLSFSNNSGAVINLFASYAAPYQFAFNATGTNGLIELNNNKLITYSPRDTFNSDGLFSTPPKILSTEYNFEFDFQKSLHTSINYFFLIVSTKSNFDTDDFNNCLTTAGLFIKCNKLMHDLN